MLPNSKEAVVRWCFFKDGLLGTVLQVLVSFSWFGSALCGGVALIVANPLGSGWSRSPHGRRDVGPGWDPQGLKTFPTFGVKQRPLGVARRGGFNCREPERVGMEL